MKLTFCRSHYNIMLSCYYAIAYAIMLSCCRVILCYVVLCCAMRSRAAPPAQPAAPAPAASTAGWWPAHRTPAASSWPPEPPSEPRSPPPPADTIMHMHMMHMMHIWSVICMYAHTYTHAVSQSPILPISPPHLVLGLAELAVQAVEHNVLSLHLLGSGRGVMVGWGYLGLGPSHHITSHQHTTPHKITEDHRTLHYNTALHIKTRDVIFLFLLHSQSLSTSHSLTPSLTSFCCRAMASWSAVPRSRVPSSTSCSEYMYTTSPRPSRAEQSTAPRQSTSPSRAHHQGTSHHQGRAEHSTAHHQGRAQQSRAQRIIPKCSTLQYSTVM